VTPFLEWSFEIPVGLPDLANAAGASAWPNILSLGARVSPWKQLHLLAAVDIGLTSAGRLGVPAVPPWQLLFGLGWAFDTTVQPAQVVVQEKVKEVVKEKVVTKEVPVPTPLPPTTGVLTGQVIDSRTAQPVPGAAIKFPGTDLTAALSGEAKGDFKISDLPAGRLRVRVEKEGFKPADFEVDIVAGKPTANSFPVDPAEKEVALAVLAGKVSDESGSPLTGIVEARDVKSGKTTKLVAEPSTGGFVGRLPVGQYVVMARSTGHLSREKTLTLNPNERVVVDFSLRKEPEKRIARLEGSKIVIAKQVNFKRGSAKIIGKESFAILDEVVDILVRHPNIKKVRVEGHTDNVGGKKYNQKLSEARARAVMEYLVSQGISPARLESQGFGQTRPLVPNTSKRNKAKNRRVDFVILEQ
jgi:OOP family OmpA-OmpF porin